VLEREFGLINVSRGAALSSTDGDSTKRLLSKTGANFRWNDLKHFKLTFVECSAEENNSLDSVVNWIDVV
jgi:hypothetical protein